MSKKRSIWSIAYLGVAAVGVILEIAWLIADGGNAVRNLAQLSFIASLLAFAWFVTVVLGESKAKEGSKLSAILSANVQGLLTAVSVGSSIIFWALLAGRIEPLKGDGWFSGVGAVVHIFQNAVVPLFLLAAWLLNRFSDDELTYKNAAKWLVVPVAYFMVVAAVGAISVAIDPTSKNFVYAFLDPSWAAAQGVEGIALNLVVAIGLLLVLCLIVFLVGLVVVWLKLKFKRAAKTEKVAVTKTEETEETVVKKTEEKVTGTTEVEKILLYESCLKRAQEGDAEAQLIVGVMNERGEGVPQDFTKAVKWYKKSAKKGNADAQNNLGYAYEVGRGVPQQDYAEAAKWYAKSADQGNANGLYNLGNSYYKGMGVKKDSKKAAELYGKAGAQGHSDAQNNLGYLYETGEGVPQNSEQAARWYGYAESQGNVYAADRLGVVGEPTEYPSKKAYYVVGGGNVVHIREEEKQNVALTDPTLIKEASDAKAYQIALKKAESGDAEAQLIVGVMNERGDGVPQNPEEAVKWYRRSATQGNADAQNTLGYAYETGRGVPQDYTEAAKWYEKAADQGNANGLYNLGNSYYKGKGVKKDSGKAAELFGKAGAAGHSGAQNNLGRLYEIGDGVPQNNEQSEKWYSYAEAQGNVYAVKRLGVVNDPTEYPIKNSFYVVADTDTVLIQEGDQPLVSDEAAVVIKVKDETVTETVAEAAKQEDALSDDEKNAILYQTYLEKAKQGDAEAQLIVGIMNEHGEGVPQNLEEAARWYKKSAKQDNANAQNNLGYAYQTGRGVPQDAGEAVKWYAKAADQDNANGLYNLGNSYYAGNGVKKNTAKAAALYEKAAEKGHSDAQNNLGYLYETGEGVPADTAEAVRWYGYAANQGNVYAQNHLGATSDPTEYPPRDTYYVVTDDNQIVIQEEEAKPNTAPAPEEEKNYVYYTYFINEIEKQEAAKLAEEEAVKAAEQAEAVKAAEEAAKAEEEKAAAAAAATAVDEKEEFLPVEKFTVEEEEDKRSDESNETAIFDDVTPEIPEGYTYQDGWYYVNETGEKVAREQILIRDDYYYNLPDELKPEFRELFVEGTRVYVPRFPFYVIDGDNTMFFRLVFTYITRYRKAISIELLDNLYDYLVKKFSDRADVVSKINDKLIRIYFARRKEDGILDKCEAKCREDINYSFAYVKDYPANLYSLKRLVMILEKQDRLYEAKALCEKALSLGMIDGTKAGYQGRLDRITRRIEEEEAIRAEDQGR
ncbi:MAG: hypothetical protein LBT20_06215 [Clostridiales bacterium]|jgi:TPR repeat protein|nr:hypothetical protein [Clostridiales bacterium]